MNRRRFLAASAAASALGAASSAAARTAKPFKAIVPPLSQKEFAELKAAAPTIELVQCQNEEEAIAQASDAEVVFGFITQRVIRAG
jgi:hypothetical protein